MGYGNHPGDEFEDISKKGQDSAGDHAIHPQGSGRENEEESPDSEAASHKTSIHPEEQDEPDVTAKDISGAYRSENNSGEFEVDPGTG